MYTYLLGEGIERFFRLRAAYYVAIIIIYVDRCLGFSGTHSPGMTYIGNLQVSLIVTLTASYANNAYWILF